MEGHKQRGEKKDLIDWSLDLRVWACNLGPWRTKEIETSQ
jgi:hypothetical protein